MERITKLAKGVWLELLEEIQNRMKNSEISDHEMVNEFTAEYPDYSYYLINSAVKTSRQFLDLSDKVRRLITDDINFFGLKTQEVIKKVSEITGKDYSLIAAVVYKLGPQINQATLVQAEILAKNCDYSLTDSPWKIAKAIMNDKLNISWEFVAGMTLANAVEDRQNELKKEERDKLEKKRLELEETKKRQEEERREKRRQEELKKDLKRAGGVKEILNRPRVPIRYSSGAASSAISLNGENEVAMMKGGTKIILGGEIYEIEKSPSGQVKKRFIDGAKVIEPEIPKSTQVVAPNTAAIAKKVKAPCLANNMIWVIFNGKIMRLLVILPEHIREDIKSLNISPGTLAAVYTDNELKVYKAGKYKFIYAGTAKKTKRPSEEERKKLNSIANTADYTL